MSYYNDAPSVAKLLESYIKSSDIEDLRERYEREISQQDRFLYDYEDRLVDMIMSVINPGFQLVDRREELSESGELGESGELEKKEQLVRIDEQNSLSITFGNDSFKAESLPEISIETLEEMFNYPTVEDYPIPLSDEELSEEEVDREFQ